MTLRIGILTFGSRGDVQPFVALAIALADRGAKPLLAAHPLFRPMVEGAGVDFAPLAGDPLDWMARQARLKAAVGKPRFAREFSSFREKHVPLMRAMLSDSVAVADEVDALIYSHGALAGPHLHQARGLPVAYAGLQPWETTRANPSVMFGQRPMLPSLLQAWWNRASHPLAERLVWHPWMGVVNEWRSGELGLPPLGAFESPWRLPGQNAVHIYGYSPVVAPPPADWPPGRNVTGWWRPPETVRWEPETALQEFLARGDPPVYVGFGSQVPLDPAQVRSVVLGALELLDRRVILASGWAGLDLLPEGADRLFTVADVPHEWLFQKTAAVVHHGGAGTTGAAVRAGVPQVVVPSFFDQFFWAERVRALGVGTTVPAAKLTAARLGAAVEQALRPEVRMRAQELAKLVAEERGADRAAGLLLDHLG